MAPTDSNNDTQSDSQTNDDSGDTALSRRGLMAAGSLAGLGVAGAGLASADDKGSGSGDADTVDGHHANEFLHVDGTETATGNLDMGGNDLENVHYMWANGNAGTWLSNDHTDARLRLWDLDNGQAMFQGHVGGPNESFYQLRTKQTGTTRVVGDNQTEFDTIQAAIDDLPTDPNDYNYGRVHVCEDYDDSAESYPIMVRGDITLTGEVKKRGTTLEPPAGGTAFHVRGSEQVDGSQENTETVQISGFFIKGQTNGADYGIYIDGGSDLVFENMLIEHMNEAGVYGTKYTTGGDYENWPVSITFRDIRTNYCKDGFRFDGDAEINHVNFYNCKSRDSDRDGYHLASKGTTFNLYGCTSEDYGTFGVYVEEARNANWYGGYLENINNSDSTYAFYYSGEERGSGSETWFQPNGEIRGAYVNGANYVLVTNKVNHVSISNINYYNVENGIATANYPNDSIRVEPETFVPTSDATVVPPYAVTPGDEGAIRVNGTYAWQDLSATWITGDYEGDTAYHNGANGDERGLYVWDPNAGSRDPPGAWIGPNGSIIDPDPN